MPVCAAPSSTGTRTLLRHLRLLYGPVRPPGPTLRPNLARVHPATHLGRPPTTIHQSQLLSSGPLPTARRLGRQCRATQPPHGPARPNVAGTSPRAHWRAWTLYAGPPTARRRSRARPSLSRLPRAGRTCRASGEPPSLWGNGLEDLRGHAARTGRCLSWRVGGRLESGSRYRSSHGKVTRSVNLHPVLDDPISLGDPKEKG